MAAPPPPAAALPTPPIQHCAHACLRVTAGTERAQSLLHSTTGRGDALQVVSCSAGCASVAGAGEPGSEEMSPAPGSSLARPVARTLTSSTRIARPFARGRPQSCVAQGACSSPRCSCAVRFSRWSLAGRSVHVIKTPDTTDFIAWHDVPPMGKAGANDHDVEHVGQSRK